MLHKRAPFTQQSCIELQDYVRQFGIQDKSLQKIYAILFKEKNIQITALVQLGS